MIRHGKRGVYGLVMRKYEDNLGSLIVLANRRKVWWEGLAW